MITDPILEKANEILIEKRIQERIKFHKAKRDKRIIEAGLCPECGEKLHISKDSNYIKEYLKKRDLYKRPNNFDYFNKIKVCSTDINHYLKVKGGYWHDDE